MLVETNVPGFKKNTETGAIINTSEEGYNRIKAMRAEAKKNAELQNKMQSLETEITEIKNLLVQLLDGNRNVKTSI